MYHVNVTNHGVGPVLQTDMGDSAQREWFVKRFLRGDNRFPGTKRGSIVVFQTDRDRLVVCSNDIVELSAEVEYLIN